MPGTSFFSALAKSFLAGEAALEPIVERLSRTLGTKWRWTRPLALRYLRAFEPETRPRRKDVTAFLLRDEGLRRALRRLGSEIRIAQWLLEPAAMRPVVAAAGWNIPAIESTGTLADWLGVTASELEWFADLKRLGARSCSRNSSNPIGHYHYRVLAKNGGSIRLIEAPKPRLKELQKKILAEILEAMPVHPAAHGFLKKHSIKTFAAPHVGQRVVLRLDLKDFFPSISRARVQALFRTAGYPESVADLLGGILTNAAPRRIWATLSKGIDPLRVAEARALYAWAHLPQGAPTSAALANPCSYRVDCRLAGLAKTAGANYTRYADDLAFSGGDAFERCANRFSTRAAAILLEEGFTVHHRKTRIMRQGVRQYLAGLVINERISVVRADFDGLKAILTNCARYGPESQNREAHPAFQLHLAGRVGYVESLNPSRGARLRRIFEQIRW